MRGLPLFMMVLAMMPGAVAAQTEPPAHPDFVVSQATDLQANPALAHDPKRDRFLSTWQDFRNKPDSSIDIYGRIVDGRGNPVTGDLPITRAKGSQGFSAVAFDPVNDRYLVVWTDWRNALDVDSDIYGRLIDVDGTPSGDEFVIAAERGVSQKFPNLAFDPVRQRFLVLWVDNRAVQIDKIFGRFVGARGDLQGEAFPVAPDGDYQDSPSLLFDQSRDQFFVAWRDTWSAAPEDLDKAVYGSLVDAGRGPDGSSFLIALEKDGCVPLSLNAASKAHGEDFYFIAWSSGRNYFEMMPNEGYPDRQRGLDVYGAFVDVADGSLRKAPFMIASEIDYQRAPSVGYDSNQNRFLVVWYDLRRLPTGRDMDIYGKFVSVAGDVTDEFLVSDEGAPGIRRYPTVAFSPKSDAFVVLWEDERLRDDNHLNRRIFGRVR